MTHGRTYVRTRLLRAQTTVGRETKNNSRNCSFSDFQHLSEPNFGTYFHDFASKYQKWIFCNNPFSWVWMVFQCFKLYILRYFPLLYVSKIHLHFPWDYRVLFEYCAQNYPFDNCQLLWEPHFDYFLKFFTINPWNFRNKTSARSHIAFKR